MQLQRTKDNRDFFKGKNILIVIPREGWIPKSKNLCIFYHIYEYINIMYLAVNEMMKTVTLLRLLEIFIVYYPWHIYISIAIEYRACRAGTIVYQAVDTYKLLYQVRRRNVGF